MALTSNQRIIAEYYIASLGRDPDLDGLNYWAGQLDSNSMTQIEIRDKFLDRSIPEVAVRFPVGQEPIETVSNIYENVFGRKGDTGGLEYWVDRLNGSVEGFEPLGENELISIMLDTAKAPENHVDVVYLENKLKTVESYYPDTEEKTSDTPSPLHNQTWVIENTQYYDIGNNILVEVNYDTSDGDADYFINTYTVDGNNYNLTGSDGNQTTLTINSLQVGQNIGIVSVSEGVNESAVITRVGEIEYNSSRPWINFSNNENLVLSAQDYFNSMKTSDGNHYNNLRIDPSSENELFHISNPSNDVGVATVKDNKLYIISEHTDSEGTAIELEISNGTTTENYYLGEIA